jgi:hypothetical protein
VGYGLLSFSYVTSLQPRPGARLLLLNSASDIDKFHQKYRQSLRASKFPPGYIGWKRVAENYDGIIIAPYCWERRHHKHARWYYTWDVASGCVWNADAMRIVECSPYQLPARAA